jgi:hypothetical protein
MSTKEFESLEDLIAHQAAIEGRIPNTDALAPSKITYLVGDATKPFDTGHHERFIVHVCNDVGAWGAGFTRALNALSAKPRASYLDAIKQTKPLSLGCMSLAKVEPTLFVANMIAQRGLPSRSRRVVIDYAALEKCLAVLAPIAADWRVSAHMPRIGCGIAGGDWHTVEAIIERTLCACGVPVYVYDLPRSTADD